MSKNKSFVGQIVKYLELSQAEMKSETGEKSENSHQKQEGVYQHQNQRQIVLHKKGKNFCRRLLKLEPTIELNHIDKVFGFVGINLKALEHPGYQQSYLFTYIQDRIIERVQVYDYAVLIEMTQPEAAQHHPPVQYLIQKYKSKGNIYFYELAVVIEEITQLIAETQLPQASKPELLKKWLDQLGEGLYLAILGTRRIAISKGLLAYLDYDIEELAVEAVKYRALLIELFSSMSYPIGITQLMKSLKYATLLNLGKISINEYRELTTFCFSDFIYSKYQAESYCDMRFYYLTPNCLVHQIDTIHYRNEQQTSQPLHTVEMKKAMLKQKERVRQSEYRTINKLKALPKGLLDENRPIIAGYKTIEPAVNQADMESPAEKVENASR